MKFSERDQWMIEKLRKRESMMARWRWALLIVHGCIAIASIVLLGVVSRFPNDNPEAKSLLVSFMVPQLFLLMAFSAGWFSYVVVNWRGNPTTNLLLKLVDELKDAGNAGSNERPPSP